MVHREGGKLFQMSGRQTVNACRLYVFISDDGCVTGDTPLAFYLTDEVMVKVTTRVFQVRQHFYCKSSLIFCGFARDSLSRFNRTSTLFHRSWASDPWLVACPLARPRRLCQWPICGQPRAIGWSANPCRWPGSEKASGWDGGMSNGRRLTLSCDWPTGLGLNSGAPPSERRDVIGLSMQWLQC